MPDIITQKQTATPVGDALQAEPQNSVHHNTTARISAWKKNLSTWNFKPPPWPKEKETRKKQ